MLFKVIQGGKTMKTKKVLAMMLAATMVMGSAISVSAATTDAEDQSGFTVTGTGNVGYVNTTIYNVGLPTTASMTLTVDPQGLSTLAEDSTATAEDLAAAAGKVYCDTVVPITNAGSVPVKVTVEMAVTGGAVVKDSEADVDAAESDGSYSTNVLMYAIPSSVDTKDADGYAASSKGIVLGATGSETDIDFIIPAADYVFSKDSSGTVTYVRDTASDVHGTALKFAGLVSKNADWSAFVQSTTKTIGLTAVFKFTHTLGTTDVADATDGAPYAMVAYNGTTVDVAPEEVAPTFTGAANGFTYTKGSGDSGLKTITSVVVMNGTTPYDNIQGVNGVYGAGTLDDTSFTFDSTYMSFYAKGAQEAIITYENNAGESKTETVQVTFN
jgi:hypothetical protein